MHLWLASRHVFSLARWCSGEQRQRRLMSLQERRAAQKARREEWSVDEDPTVRIMR